MTTVMVSITGEIGDMVPEALTKILWIISAVTPEAWAVVAEIQHPKPERPIPRVVGEILAY